MKKFAYAAPALLLSLTTFACGDDGGSAVDTEGGTTNGSESTTDDPTSSTTEDPTTGVSTTTDDPTDTMDDCTPDDQCRADADCPGGGMCLGCVCVGGDECPDGRPDGEYGDCRDNNTAACTGAATGCVGDGDAAVCFVPDCSSLCDCPVGPAGFEEQVTCDQLTADGGEGCYISCEDGEACPDGMGCVGGFLCAFTEFTATYGDCINGPAACEGSGSICITDAASYGVCASPCMSAADCPDAPATGDATVACLDVTMGIMGTECILDCTGGATCPDGMTCLDGAEVCVWTPPNLGFNDCANYPLANACQDADEFCTTEGTASICSEPCTTDLDCPLPPDTGDAVVTCGEIDDTNAGMECYLSCENGETCPDGATCINNTECLFENDPNTVFEEDFEGSTDIPLTFATYDEDGLTPSGQVDFFTEAWVITPIAMNNLAGSTSFYAPAGQADDWLVTPAITIGDADTLRWVAAAQDPDFPDGYEVLVTTVGNQPADFTDAPVFTIANERTGVPTPRFVDLAAAGYMNVDIFVAFRNNSTDQFILRVDDIRITN